MAVTIDAVRAVTAELPRSYEALVRGCVKFRVGQIVYVSFSADGSVMGFAFPREWRVAAVETAPDKFLMPLTADLRYNWLRVRMDAIDVDEMRDLVLEAWSMVVPQRVIDEYIARHPGVAGRA